MKRRVPKGLVFLHIYVSITSSPGSAVLSHPARHHFQRCFVRPTAAGTDEPALRAALWESSTLKALLWGAKAPVVASSAAVSHCHRHFLKSSGIHPGLFLFWKGQKGLNSKKVWIEMVSQTTFRSNSGERTTRYSRRNIITYMHRSNNSSPYPLFERLFAVI